MRIVFLIMVMIILAIPAYATDFSALDKKYCTEIDQTKHCLFFEHSVFGPGWRGDAYLEVKHDQVFSPIKKDVFWWAEVSSQDGITLKIHDSEYIGIFGNGELHLIKQGPVLEAQ